MDKRYQVFVSSTYSDLREERKSIIEGLLNARFIPAGMELFSASNDEQFEYIKKIIDNCDYYVLVIAARYGSINSTSGKSYTELEYDYAVSKKIPIIVFLHDDPYILPADKRDDKNRKLLEAFRKKASNTRMCKMWHTQTELVSSVIVSIFDLVSNNPQPGWLRGGEYDNAELLSQINAIRIEKDKLEKEIDRLNSIIGKGSVIIDNIAKGSELYEVYGTRKIYTGYNEEYSDHKITLTWDSIFSAIGPHLISPQTYAFFESKLNDAINAAYGSDFYYINEDCTQTIKIQLCAYELIKVKTEISKKGDITEIIGLTEKGKVYLLKLKSVKTMMKDTSPEQNTVK